MHNLTRAAAASLSFTLQLKQMIFDNSRAISSDREVIIVPPILPSEAMEAENGVRGCVVVLKRILLTFLRKCASCLLR